MSEHGRVATSFRLTPETLELLREAARLDRRTKTQIVELAIEDYYAKLVKGADQGKAAA